MGSIISQICQFFSKIKQLLYEVKEKRILIIGLGASGKTTILYQLKFGEVKSTEPTAGFNCETVKYNNVNFTLWDVGGEPGVRGMWRYYFQGVNGLIFVVDSSNKEAIVEATDELRQLLDNEQLRNTPLLVLANKQDLPESLKVQEIVYQMNLHSIYDRKWFAQGTSAISGEGLFEGLDWLGAIFRDQKKKELMEACRRN